MIQFFLRATHKWVFQFGFTYILTSHLVLGLYLTLIMEIFISDGHIDGDVEELQNTVCSEITSTNSRKHTVILLQVQVQMKCLNLLPP